MPAGPEPTTATFLPVRWRGGCGFTQPSENAGCLARRGTHAARELGEIVGSVQRLNRSLGLRTVDVIIPVGDQVAERTARIAKRYAAIHAARTLSDQLVLHDRQFEFPIVV